MENLQIFENDNFGQLRTIDDDDNGKVMFVASDVAKMLGYTNASKAISDHCRYVTKRYIPHPLFINRTIKPLSIPERGYFCVLP